MLLGVGLLHGSRIWSYAQMLMDCEIWSMLESMFKGIEVTQESLALDVIAEGVETRQQLEFLLNNGCDFVQGHYIDRPLSAQRTAEVIGQA